MRRNPHAQRLERWLGAATVADLSASVATWYGPPIAVGGVPGLVYARGGGDFVGPVEAGGFASLADLVADRLAVERRRVAKRLDRWFRENRRERYVSGFANLGDLLDALKDPMRFQAVPFTKAGTAAATSFSGTHWFVGSYPAAGAAAAAAPGGTVPTSATTGAMPIRNAASGNTLHFVGGSLQAGTAQGNLLLYDRLFSVTKTMNSTATEAVTGVPTRYQNTTAGAADSAEGNFLFMECRTVLPSTGHNWTVCQYTDQAGNTGATLPSVVGVASCAANRLDMGFQPGNWFAPLASGDSGILALTQMQCSALVASGAIDFVIGHPIGIIPAALSGPRWIANGINSALSLARVFDDACLSTLDITRSGGTAVTLTGTLTFAEG